jgi:hypothetical protein
MHRPLRLALVVAAICGVASLAACNSDEDCCDDLESYFERVDEIDNDTREDFRILNDDLTAAFPAGGASLNEGTRGSLTAAFARGEQSLADVVTELEEITPPPEVAEAHFETIEGYNEFRQSYAVMRARVPNIFSAADLVAALEGQADVGQRANEACDALQKIADDNAIEVTLDCGVETP